MLTFEPDGSTTIEFPDGPVKVRPPTFGGLKRLRAERVRLARDAQDKIRAWDDEHPAPEGPLNDETGERDPADQIDVARYAEDRILAVEEANLEATVAWWRLLLLGDGTFKALADGSVPDDVDDWPAALLFDVRPLIPPNSSVEVILSAQSAPDQWVRHVGNVHCRSGSTNGAAAATVL